MEGQVVSGLEEQWSNPNPQKVEALVCSQSCQNPSSFQLLPPKPLSGPAGDRPEPCVRENMGT